MDIRMPDGPMERGRLEKALGRQYNWADFGAGVMTLGAFLRARKPVLKSYSWREYASKKREGVYKRLATPKAEYTVWFDADRKGGGIDVPKIVYDALDLPEQTPTYVPETRPAHACYRCGEATVYDAIARDWMCPSCRTWQGV